MNADEKKAELLKKLYQGRNHTILKTDESPTSRQAKKNEKLRAARQKRKKIAEQQRSRYGYLIS